MATFGVKLVQTSGVKLGNQASSLEGHRGEAYRDTDEKLNADEPSKRGSTAKIKPEPNLTQHHQHTHTSHLLNPHARTHTHTQTQTQRELPPSRSTTNKENNKRQ